jgi:dihydroflavonol-4-reductase
VKPTPTGRLILDFLRGRLPAYIDAHLNIVDVEDVAVGHLLAWQKGRTGQRYLLGHRNMTMKEILEALARITGRRAPRLRIPLWLALALGHVDAVLEGAILRKEPLIPLEGVQHAWRPRPVDCSKALRELGFPQTPVEQALEKAVRWFREHGYVP